MSKTNSINILVRTKQALIEKRKKIINQLLIEKAKSDLKVFCIAISSLDRFSHIKINQKWVCDVIVTLEDLIDSNDIDRAIFNIPPRTGKTTIITTFGVCFLLGKLSYNKFLIVNANDDKLQEINQDIKYIINSEIYQQIFHVKDLATKNAVRQIKLTNGNRITFKVSGSAVIGAGYHWIFFDDYLNPNNETSIARKEQAKRNLSSFQSRREYGTKRNKATKQIVIEQRVGVEDTTAICLTNWKSGEVPYFHLSLPYYFEDELIYRNTEYKQGEYLDIKFDEKDKKIIIAERGYEIFQTQYQQNPITRIGAYIPTDKFQYYYSDEKIFFSEIFITMDTAEKTGKHNDYSVACVWGLSNRIHHGRGGETYNSGLYLIEMMRGKYEFLDLKQKISNLYRKYEKKEKYLISIGCVYIEEKSSGTALIQELRNLNIPTSPLKADKSKSERADLLLSPLDANQIYLPKDEQYKDDINTIIKEMKEFEVINGKVISKHDDIVDCFSYAVQKKLIRKDNFYDYSIF